MFRATLPTTLEGLSEAYTTAGQYDQAMTALMRALELARKAGDQSGIAVISRQIGLVLGYQGRFGAAVKSLQDAVNAFRQQGENGHSMAEALNDLARALARAGRGDESTAPLDEAEKIQQALKNDALQADILNTQGDIAFYRGDLKNAARLYDSALRLASRTKESEVMLLSKLNVAKVAGSTGSVSGSAAYIANSGSMEKALSPQICHWKSVLPGASRNWYQRLCARQSRAAAGAGDGSTSWSTLRPGADLLSVGDLCQAERWRRSSG